MGKRTNYYMIEKDGEAVRVRRKGADDRLVFNIIEKSDEVKNSRNQDCIRIHSNHLKLPNDMVIVRWDRERSLIMYLEKWKLYYSTDVNLIKDGNNVVILVPRMKFKTFTSESWLDWEGYNLTWNSIKDQLQLEEIPSNLSDHLPLFNNDFNEAKKGK